MAPKAHLVEPSLDFVATSLPPNADLQDPTAPAVATVREPGGVANPCLFIADIFTFP